MSDVIGDGRFIPHLTLHEFETLLFASPDGCADQAGDPKVSSEMQAVITSCGEPELIDNGPETAPSKRLLRAWPRYAKTIDGPTIAGRIGLDRIRSTCPHFHTWLTMLETL